MNEVLALSCVSIPYMLTNSNECLASPLHLHLLVVVVAVVIAAMLPDQNSEHDDDEHHQEANAFEASGILLMLLRLL